MNKNALETLGEGKYQYTKWQYTGIGVHCCGSGVSLQEKRRKRRRDTSAGDFPEKRKKENKKMLSPAAKEKISTVFSLV